MHLLPSSSDHMNARFTVGLPVPSTIATNNAPPDGAGLLTVPITEYETSIYSLCSTADTAETEKECAKEKIHSALSKLGCTTNERFEPGQVLYSVCTPDTTAKIQKLHSSFDNDNYTLAEIEYHKFSSTILNFGGEEFKARNFFEKRMISKLCCHRRDRRFVGPDGKAYRWIVGFRAPSLVLDDGSDTIVAQYHFEPFGIIHSRRSASLEITPLGMHMVDLIFITFIYIWKIRKSRTRPEFPMF